MSEVLQRIDGDIKSAMKNKDQIRLETLRMVKTAVKNKEIELIRALTEQEFVQLLTTLVKQRRDSADQYTKAGRVDLAEKENGEITIISEYLPKQLSLEELNQLIAAAIQKSGAAGPQDMGKVMKELKDATTGKVDGKVLADAVKTALQK